jgi:hypothetical protein
VHRFGRAGQVDCVDDGTTRDRFVICHNPERAQPRPRGPRADPRPPERADRGTDKLTAIKRREHYGALATTPAFKRLLRQTATGKLRIDRAAVTTGAKLDGKQRH